MRIGTGINIYDLPLLYASVTISPSCFVKMILPIPLTSFTRMAKTHIALSPLPTLHSHYMWFVRVSVAHMVNVPLYNVKDEYSISFIVTSLLIRRVIYNSYISVEELNERKEQKQILFMTCISGL